MNGKRLFEGGGGDLETKDSIQAFETTNVLTAVVGQVETCSAKECGSILRRRDPLIMRTKPIRSTQIDNHSKQSTAYLNLVLPHKKS